MGRRAAAAVAVLLAVPLMLGLTACSSGLGATPTGDRSASRPAPVTTPGPDLYAAVVARMVEEGSAHFTFSGIGGGETISGAGQMRFAAGTYDADVELTMAATGRVRAVLMPTVCFLALPNAKGLPKGKPWLRVAPLPTSSFGKQLSPVVDQLRGSFDPSQALGLLQAARRVTEVGPATVEGEPTTRHHAVIGLRRATAMAEGPLEKQYQSMLDAGVKTLEYDVWLDTDGLPRKFSTDIPTSVGLYSVTGIYRDWGKKVSIESPSAKEVFDADDLDG